MANQSTEIVITAMLREHWHDVEAIFRAGIATGQATFESSPPSADVFFESKLVGHRFVALLHGEVVGWVAISAVSSRTVYAGVVEHSVYVAPSVRGRGVGARLLDALIESTEAYGIWTIQSSVFPENLASLALHASHGFREVGRRERIARMAYGPLSGQWRDTTLIERRSRAAGLQ
jgi:phosphinothricin acetyltransferase